MNRKTCSMGATLEHDLSAREWGRNYELIHVPDDGLKVSASIWATPTPREGDFLILSNPRNLDGKVRYRIDKITPCRDPRDMAFVELSFAPRGAKPEYVTKPEVKVIHTRRPWLMAARLLAMACIVIAVMVYG